MLFKRFLQFVLHFIKKRRLNPKPRISPQQALGYKGEKFAVQHLKNKGFKVIARNWRHASGEIDIIASDGPVLVFVEVKARSQSSGNAAYYAVNKKKKESLRKACVQYLKSLKVKPKHYRFDVIEVGLMANKAYTIQHHSGVPLFSKYFFVAAKS